MIYKTLILLLLALNFTKSYSQESSISSDSILLKLTITTREGENFETVVSIENSSTHKIKHFKTSKDGRADCVLYTGESYSIKIPESDDSYEYSIPDFSISPLTLTFKFGIKEENNSSVGIRLFNMQGLNNITIRSQNTASMSYNITNDTAYVKVVKEKEYSIFIKGVEITNNSIQVNPNNKALSYILNFIDETHAELIPLKITESVLNVIYQNLSDMPVKGETIIVKGTSSNSNYKLKTGINGSALAILPTNDKYKISLKYFPNVFKINVGKETNTIFTNTVKLKYPSSKEFEIQKEDQAKRLAKRDSLYMTFGKIKEKILSDLKTHLATQDSAAIKGLREDEYYFKNHNIEVCEVLNRNKNKWKSKMIVTDVTGSMYPYMEQVALWHLLELMNKERSDYIFFIDGDNRPDNLKIIGNTGGIYVNLNTTPDSVIQTMYLAMKKGNGGDGPENDIEALIEGLKYKKENVELVLIADHLSPVKDIELLNQIKVPVRVILCGSKDGYSNPDYLEIAYKTGGSIHTIEEDITNLSKLHNEDIITIAGTMYKFIGGQFFPVTRKM